MTLTLYNHFVQFIQDYNSAINYNTAYSKMAYKYLFKAFYNKSNKKEYKLQIWQHNMYYTNIIVIKDVIILEKVKKKEKLLENTKDTTILVKIAWVSSLIDLT